MGGTATDRKQERGQQDPILMVAGPGFEPLQRKHYQTPSRARVFCVIHPRSVAGGKRISQTVALAVRLLPGMAHMAISIVDSNDTFRKSLRAFITGLGHEVFEPSTGQEAMDKACSVHPDLIPMERVRKLI